MKNKTNNNKKGPTSDSMLVPLTPTPAQIENFKAKINFEGDGGCWLWEACKDKDDYGVFKSKVANGTIRMIKAHRLAHVVFNNTQPLEKVVRHQCKSKSCCNPAHHLLGTPLDNYLDSVRDGTAVVNQVGELCRNSKLKWSEVAEIRRAYSHKEMNQYELAQKFEVHQSNISSIVQNITWIDEDYKPPQKSSVYNPVTKAEIKQIRKLRSEGKTLRQIAEETGRSSATVSRHVKKV